MYEWKCPECKTVYESNNREFGPDCCSVPTRRYYGSVQLGVSTFKPHFNHAVGEYVSSSRHFDDALKRAGEVAGSEYTRLDPGDQPRPTTDDHIFDTQAKTIRDRGIDPASLVR